MGEAMLATPTSDNSHPCHSRQPLKGQAGPGPPLETRSPWPPGEPEAPSLHSGQSQGGRRAVPLAWVTAHLHRAATLIRAATRYQSILPRGGPHGGAHD